MSIPAELRRETLLRAAGRCEYWKGARLKVRDPLTGKMVPLFHPRREKWSAHFRWKGNRVEGRSPSGRASVFLLKMNRALAVAIRKEERLIGRHPPND
jgi:hypothetical protein